MPSELLGLSSCCVSIPIGAALMDQRFLEPAERFVEPGEFPAAYEREIRVLGLSGSEGAGVGGEHRTLGLARAAEPGVVLSVCLLNADRTVPAEGGRPSREGAELVRRGLRARATRR